MQKFVSLLLVYSLIIFISCSREDQKEKLHNKAEGRVQLLTAQSKESFDSLHTSKNINDRNYSLDQVEETNGNISENDISLPNIFDLITRLY